MPRNNFFYVLTTAALRTPLTRPRHGPFMEESINLSKIEICSLVWSLLMNGRIELILESVVYLLKLNKLEVLRNKSTDKRFSQYMFAVSG